MQRPRILPALVAGIGVSVLSLSNVASGGPLQIQSQSVKPDFAKHTLDFKIVFDQFPDFTTVGANGHPIQNFGYDIKTDAASGTFVDFDRAIRRPSADLSVEISDRDSQGNLVNPRGPIPFDVHDAVLTFSTTFETIKDNDGKFLYRVFAVDNGEITSEAAGATIPLPAGVWIGFSGLVMLIGKRALVRV